MSLSGIKTMTNITTMEKGGIIVSVSNDFKEIAIRNRTIDIEGCEDLMFLLHKILKMFNGKMHPIKEKILRLHSAVGLSHLSFRGIGRIIDEQEPVHPQCIKHHLQGLVSEGYLKFSDIPNRNDKKSFGN